MIPRTALRPGRIAASRGARTAVALSALLALGAGAAPASAAVPTAEVVFRTFHTGDSHDVQSVDLVTTAGDTTSTRCVDLPVDPAGGVSARISLPQSGSYSVVSYGSLGCQPAFAFIGTNGRVDVGRGGGIWDVSAFSPPQRSA